MNTACIDLANLDHLFRGDWSRMEDWMLLYLTEAPAYFDQLSASLASGDAGALAAAAHELCPQAHYLGCTRLLELLVALEQRATTMGTQACKELLDSVLAVAVSIEAELHALLTGPAPAPKNR